MEAELHDITRVPHSYGPDDICRMFSEIKAPPLIGNTLGWEPTIENDAGELRPRRGRR